jgi:hypothetical protein
MKSGRGGVGDSKMRRKGGMVNLRGDSQGCSSTAYSALSTIILPWGSIKHYSYSRSAFPLPHLPLLQIKAITAAMTPARQPVPVNTTLDAPAVATGALGVVVEPPAEAFVELAPEPPEPPPEPPLEPPLEPPDDG